MSESSGRIFVSSTCYDLIDLRSALFETLRSSGLNPVMSDTSSSGFENPGDANSIETCLVNLRSSECCVVVLSQRYGPSLKDRGFADVSATHLEYREALAAGIPTMVYVRDRLRAEHVAYLKNPELVTSWTTQKDKVRLFALLSEVYELQNAEKPNFVWEFTAAPDLCGRVLKDLGTTASNARLRAMAAMGALPLLTAQCGESPGKSRTGSVMNAGGVSALRVTVFQPNGQVVKNSLALRPGERLDFRFACDLADVGRVPNHFPTLRVVYEAPTGDRIADIFAILMAGVGAVRLRHAGRVLLEPSLALEAPSLHDLFGMKFVENRRLLKIDAEEGGS